MDLFRHPNVKTGDAPVNAHQPFVRNEWVHRGSEHPPAMVEQPGAAGNQANLALGRYDDAIGACEKAASLDDDWFIHVHLVAAYALQGNDGKAQAERTKLFTQRLSSKDSTAACQHSPEPAIT
jgi:hypothetical protein